MNSQTVSIDEAKNHLSELVSIASQGGEVIIVKDGKPLARLIAAADSALYQSQPPNSGEFSSDDETLAWDGDGWQNIT